MFRNSHFFYGILIGALLSVSLSIWYYKDSRVQAKGSAPSLELGDPLPANLFVELAKAVNPTVVNISTSRLPDQKYGRQLPGQRDPLFDLFEQFMRPNPGQRRPGQSLGTGFIIRKDGLIITNNHVIEGADVIKVQLSEKSDDLHEAEVIGKDARTDIALIQIDVDRELPIAKLGSSKDLEVGEWVSAFGNPYGHGHTMTKGIVSAKGREIDQINLFPFLQTDASINPGNSGGPLVNSKGLVIGVNTAIDARAQGIGFAIPIDNVKSILPQLEEKGTVERGFIGVVMTDLDEDSAESLGLSQSNGALVTQIMEGSPADKAGIEPYDLIVKFGDQKVEGTRDLIKAVAGTPVGKKAKITVVRKDKKVTLSVTVGEHPDNQAALRQDSKSYKGQKAFKKFGFSVVNYSRQLREDFSLPPLDRSRPVVIDVERGSIASRAGLAPGDIILDVNKMSVKSVQDLELREGRVNVLRVLRGRRVALVVLKP